MPKKWRLELWTECLSASRSLLGPSSPTTCGIRLSNTKWKLFFVPISFLRVPDPILKPSHFVPPPLQAPQHSEPQLDKAHRVSLTGSTLWGIGWPCCVSSLLLLTFLSSVMVSLSAASRKGLTCHNFKYFSLKDTQMSLFSGLSTDPCGEMASSLSISSPSFQRSS